MIKTALAKSDYDKVRIHEGLTFGRIIDKAIYGRVVVQKRFAIFISLLTSHLTVLRYRRIRKTTIKRKINS